MQTITDETVVFPESDTFDTDVEGLDLYQLYAYGFTQILGKAISVWLFMNAEEDSKEPFELKDGFFVAMNDLTKQALMDENDDSVAYKYYKKMGNQRCLCVNGRISHLAQCTIPFIETLPELHKLKMESAEITKIGNDDERIKKLMEKYYEGFILLRPVLFALAMSHFMGLMASKPEERDNPYLCRGDCRQKPIEVLKSQVKSGELKLDF